MQKMELNEAKKDYNEPMHTTEHILNQTMVRMFGCTFDECTYRAQKIQVRLYALSQAPTEAQIEEITNRVNDVIGQQLPVTESLMNREEASRYC